jgi:hypothetical protein
VAPPRICQEQQLAPRVECNRSPRVGAATSNSLIAAAILIQIIVRQLENPEERESTTAEIVEFMDLSAIDR